MERKKALFELEDARHITLSEMFAQVTLEILSCGKVNQAFCYVFRDIIVQLEDDHRIASIPRWVKKVVWIVRIDRAIDKTYFVLRSKSDTHGLSPLVVITIDEMMGNENKVEVITAIKIKGLVKSS